MAQQNAAKVVSQYPLPPKRYYESGALRTNGPPLAPTANDSYSMFGRVYTTDDALPSLEESGRVRLYDADKRPCEELARLNKELLALFMKLVRSLCEPLPPDSPPQPHKEIIQAVEDTFVNMQHLINVMRPAQAAMDLKTLLDRQTATRKDMAEKLNDSVKRAWDLIGDAAEKLSQPSVQLSKESMAPLSVASRESDDAKQAALKGKAAEEDAALQRDFSQVLDVIGGIVEDATL